jgi:prevent-host-death family protein
MREIQASETRARLSQLLDEVEQGETIVITRHGRAIARIVSEADRRRREIDEALADTRELRMHTRGSESRRAARLAARRS